MAFLDNSGDIILDAVLTDAGRKRLAQGDGSFRIAKFALGDDEIDYGLFDKSHTSGSAYYDLEIMQTPVLEAFTNNTSVLKYKLMSMPQTNLLYLPEIRLNDLVSGAKAVYQGPSVDIDQAVPTDTTTTGKGIFYLSADDSTKSGLAGSSLQGNTLNDENRLIRVDQGLNTTDISFKRDISPDLRETQYIIQADSRMLTMREKSGQNQITESYIDDDMQASYYVTENDALVTGPVASRSDRDTLAPDEVISGPFGTKLEFNLRPSTEIETSTSLFLELGGGSGSTIVVATKTYYYIDTNVRVTGATTGSSIDIPVRILKKQ